jgi:hypothetical protein
MGVENNKGSLLVRDIKARLSLVDVVSVDVQLRRNGQTRWSGLCPFHREKTPSFTIYAGRDGVERYKCWGCGESGDVVDYWQKTQGGDFGQAIERLAQMAGIAPGDVAERKRVVAPAAVVEDEVKPLGEVDCIKWAAAAAELAHSDVRLQQWAQWRGLSDDVMRWAAARRLCGTLVYRGEWREAFAIERPSEAGLEQMGYHVRLAPNSQGNRHDRASWRYEPQGIGSWPVVVLPQGGMESARFVFVCEGQWDVLALVDLMGWQNKWPDSVAVFGLRGATTWRRLLEYKWRVDATVFMLADRDEAGRRWLVGDGCFSEEMRKHVRFVYGFWPKIVGAKDLNDAVRAMGPKMREVVRGELRRKVLSDRSGRRVTKATFFSWSRKQIERDDAVGKWGRWVNAMRGVVPKRRPHRSVWLRFMDPHKEAKSWFFEAWKEWEHL